MAAMLHARNNTILFLWDKMFILMQNIFIVPGMQHGRRAKPLLGERPCVAHRTRCGKNTRISEVVAPLGH